MPRRNYRIFDWKEGETIDDQFDYVKHSAHIDVLGVEEFTVGGARYLLEVTDENNLDSDILFEIKTDGNGTIVTFQALPDLKKYSNIKVENPKNSGEVLRTVVRVMGNDLGETLYLMHIKHKKCIKDAFEFEVIVSPTEQLTYTQEPPDQPLAMADEEDA